jgi:tetratricopeptide (TPR) repeat protein
MQPASLSESIARHERYHASDPSNAMLLRTLGDLYHQSGQFDKALDAYERTRALNPGDRSLRSRVAGVFLSQNRLEDAELALRALLAEGSDDAALHHMLGICLYHREQYAGAIAELRAARERGLADPDGLHYLAYALHRTGAMQEALEVVDAWLKLAPAASTAGYRALVQMEGGDMEGAVQFAGQVVAHAPDEPSANLVLGIWSIEKQDIDDARNRFERLSATDPDNARAWVGLALTQLYLQQHAASIASFERALEIVPDNVGTIVALAWTHFTNRDVAAAERTFRQAIAVERNFGEAHGGLALVLVWQNRREEARREITLARRLDPRGFGLAYAQSVLMALEGQRPEGEALLARKLEQSLREGGMSIMDNIRMFLRKQYAGPPPKKMRLTVRR